MNLRIIIDDKACKQGIHPGFETRGEHHQKPKIRKGGGDINESMTTHEGLMSSKKKRLTFFFNYDHLGGGGVEEFHEGMNSLFASYSSFFVTIKLFMNRK